MVSSDCRKKPSLAILCHNRRDHGTVIARREPDWIRDDEAAVAINLFDERFVGEEEIET